MVARLVRDQEVVGSSPVTSTKKKNSAFMRGFSFCIQETDSTAALGPDTSALSRLRAPRKKAQHFFGERRSGGECAAEATRPPREAFQCSILVADGQEWFLINAHAIILA